MDIASLPVFSTLLDLAYTGLLALTDLLAPAVGPPAAALAVVLVTIAVRAGLIPAGIAQAKADRVRARLAQTRRELQRRHRRDPERLQRETMQLYRSEGASPFAGCLPVLIQAPIVGLLYSVFLHPTIAGQPNGLLAHTLLGVPLGTSLAGTAASGAATPTTWLVLGCLIAAVALVGEATRRMLPPPAADVAGTTTAPRIPAAIVQALPFATAAVAAFVPLAAGLYLLVTVSWTLGQRLILRRRYPIPG